MGTVSCIRLGVIFLAFATGFARAQPATFSQDVKDSADRVLTLMAFSVIPDLSASFLSFGDGRAGDASLVMTQVSGGKTLTGKYPVYLEGSLGYMRYDPNFWVTKTNRAQEISGNWNTFSATGGIGWDFAITKNLIFRPILNVSLGRVDSQFAFLGRDLATESKASGDFLNNGQLNAYGLGGSLMLDYTLVQPEREIDIELRYTNIRLRTFNTSPAVNGTALAEAASVYGRYRAPTGFVVMERPLRYVLELSSTTYLGDQRGALGFNYLSSVGAGIELDTSAISNIISRARIVGRYAYGENVHGFSIGLALSF